MFPGNPDPNLAFGVICNDKLIYRVSYIPGYYSDEYAQIITYFPVEPNFIQLVSGTQESDFYGEEIINDQRIIQLLSQDNKLKDFDL